MTNAPVNLTVIAVEGQTTLSLLKTGQYPLVDTGATAWSARFADGVIRGVVRGAAAHRRRPQFWRILLPFMTILPLDLT